MGRRESEPTKALVILTLNEIEGSRAIYDHIPLQLFDRVLLVDGGSTDGTIEFWEARGVEVVNKRSPGRGSAFIYALEESQEDILLFFSPDGNENPNDIPRLLDAVENADLAIATRFGKGGYSDDAGPIRLFGNLFFTYLCNILFGSRLTDAVNGFRAIWRDKMQTLELPESKFEIEMQMTIRAAKYNFDIVEVPTYEPERIGGESKAKTLEVGMSYIRLIFEELIIGRRF